MTSSVQHFTVEVVFAAADEVLPDLKHQGHLPAVVIGFVIGVAVLLSLQRMEQRADAARAAGGKAGLPAGMLAAVGVDLLIDGMLVGLGATLGARQGIILTVALTLEIGFLALAVTAELAESASRARGGHLRRAGAGRARRGADRRAGPGPRTRRDPGGRAGRGIAALLFLVTEELITEAHESATDTPVLTGLFFAGFLALYALEDIGG